MCGRSEQTARGAEGIFLAFASLAPVAATGQDPVLYCRIKLIRPRRDQIFHAKVCLLTFAWYLSTMIGNGKRNEIEYACRSYRIG